MKALSIRTYLTRLIWLCVLPLLLLTFYLAFQHVDSLEFQLNREAADRAHDVSTAIDDKIEAQIAGLQLLAASSLANDTAHTKEFYEEAQGFHETFGGHVVLADLSLQMLFNTRVPFGTTLPKLPQPKGHAAAPAVLATGKPAVGDMFPGPIAKETLVAVVVPVVRGGATRSLLLSTIETSQFQRLLDNLTLPHGWSLILIDGKSEVMARRAFEGSAGSPGAEEPRMRVVVNSAVALWSVVLEIPRSVYRAPIVRAVAALAVAILAISFISILVGSQAARRLARAVATLTATRSPEISRPVIAEVEEIRRVLAEAAEAREAADSALREQDRLVGAIADTSPAIIYVYNMTTGSNVYINAGIARLLGYSPEEVRALGAELFGRLIHPDDLPGVIAFQSRILAARDEDVLEIEYRMRHRDGAWFTLHSYERPFNRNPDGSVRQKIGIAIDISDRKRVEEELQESEKRYRNLLETAPVGIAVHSEGKVVFTNPAGARLLGADTEEQIVGKPVTEIIHPDGLPEAQARIQRMLAGERGLYPAEDVYLRLDGTPVNVEVMATLLTYRGRPAVQVIVTDITERKRAEKTLRVSEANLRKAQEIAQLGSWTLDFSGRDTWSDEMYRICGVSPETFMLNAVSFINLIHPDDRPAMEEWMRACAAGERPGELEFRVVLPDGTVRFICGQGELLADADGRPTHMTGTAQDITERKRAEEELLRSEAEFRRLSQEFNGLLDAIPDSLTLVDTDLKILWANRAAVGTVGMTAEAVAGRHCYDLWHNRSSVCDPCPVARSFTTGQSQSETVTEHDGRIWDIRTVPIVDAQGRVTRVIEVKRDITEHRRLEDQLRQAQKLEGIGQLAGGIAHDFNNVLGAVMGFAGVLQMRMSEGDPLRHYTDELVAAGERGANLTRQILAFSRKQVFDLKPVRLNGIVRGLEKMLRRLLPESIDISQDLHEEDPVVLVDIGQIEQVLINLATNARDAIAGIGRIGIATARFAMDRDFVEAHGYGEPGEYVVLSVSDTGCGMDAATRARIFEPFFTTKEMGKGTGLGLAVVYGIVKQHRGFVNVYSEVGKGTVVRIYLPLAAGAVSDISAAAPSARIAGGNETILVAEDDEILRKLSRTVLGQHGYMVIEAEDGEDAVAKFAANQDTIRLVILDGLMPRMGGVEALEKIRRLCPGIKAVFMSGYADDIFPGGGLRDKAASFIQKPVMPTDLLRKVREVLDR